jgi:hypothetical protein
VADRTSIQEQTGVDRSRQEQTGADRSRQEQTGADKSRQEQTGADKSSRQEMERPTERVPPQRFVHFRETVQGLFIQAPHLQWCYNGATVV